MSAASIPELRLTVTLRLETQQVEEAIVMQEGGPARRLRLIDPTGHARSVGSTPPRSVGSAPPEELTLRQVWERYILPDAKLRRSPRTIYSDQCTLRLLERLANPRTSSPWIPGPLVPVQQIDDQVIVAWRNALAASGISAATANKHMRVVRKILNAACRAGLISQVPAVPMLPVPRSRPGLVTIEEVDALYRAADAASWPRIPGREPADFWRTILVACWTYGFRTQDLVGYASADQDGLLWSELHFDPQPPYADVLCSSPNGWLDYQPAKTLRTRGERILLPLSSTFRRHLEMWRGLDDRRVFPNGRSKLAYQTAWRTIREAAGVPDDVTLSASTGGRRRYRSVRKACANNWDRTSGRQLGKWVLGHQPMGTTDRYYIDVLPELIDWIDRLPEPESFSMKERSNARTEAHAIGRDSPAGRTPGDRRG